MSVAEHNCSLWVASQAVTRNILCSDFLTAENGGRVTMKPAVSAVVK